MRVIPCLDVTAGRVVKGVNFVDLVDAGDPVEQAKLYDKEGADELCFLDITASSDNRDTLYDVVARTAEQCFMPLTVGGGVRSIDDIRKLLARRRRQDLDQHRRRGAARIRRRSGGEIRQPMHRRRHRREADRRRRRGKSSPMAAGAAPASTRSNGRSAWWRRARAKSC